MIITKLNIMVTKLKLEIKVLLFSKHILPGVTSRDNLIPGKNYLIQGNFSINTIFILFRNKTRYHTAYVVRRAGDSTMPGTRGRHDQRSDELLHCLQQQVKCYSKATSKV